MKRQSSLSPCFDFNFALNAVAAIVVEFGSELDETNSEVAINYLQRGDWPGLHFTAIPGKFEGQDVMLLKGTWNFFLTLSILLLL